MSPQSLLHTPVDLLRDAPHDAGRTSHGERAERRAALGAVIGLVCVLAAGAAASTWSSTPAPCAEQAKARAERNCPAH